MVSEPNIGKILHLEDAQKQFLPLFLHRGAAGTGRAQGQTPSPLAQQHQDISGFKDGVSAWNQLLLTPLDKQNETVSRKFADGVSGAFAACSIIDIKPNITWWLILVALLFSSGVGLFFGIYPARKAAQMSPIDALRSE